MPWGRASRGAAFGPERGYGRCVTAYSWHDLSPDDGCHLVRFVTDAASVQAAAQAVRGTPHVRHTTGKKLLKEGRFGPASAEDAAVATAHPGRVVWRDDNGGWHVL